MPMPEASSQTGVDAASVEQALLVKLAFGVGTPTDAQRLRELRVAS
jgi:hypothetical protein